MDIIIHFEDESLMDVSIKDVVRRDVTSESYRVWFVDNEKVCERVFETKAIRSVSVHRF